MINVRYPDRPSGYLLNGTPMYDLRDVAASHGLTLAACEAAFNHFIWWLARQTGGMQLMQAGVMYAGDERIHRVQ